MTRDELRTSILAKGLTNRWRGLNAVTWDSTFLDNDRNRASVREVLDELVAEGTVEHGAGYAHGAWRLARKAAAK